MKLRRLELKNFKGCKSSSYDFSNRTEVSGKNGAGKSTLVNAYLWVFADSDYQFNKNPDIRPIGECEGDVCVTCTLDIDGVEVTVSKIQKKTVKEKADGTEETSLSNTYEVNGVGMGKQSFVKKMDEYEIDLSGFISLSHTDSFVSIKQADMRKALFEMVTDVTDIDVAKQTENAEKAAELLEKYSMQEVEAMQKQTLKKVKEVYGKDGELLRAEISGLEQSKVNIDVSELELQKNGLNEQIKALEDTKNNLNDDVATNLQQEIMDLKFSANGMVTDAEFKYKQEIADLNNEKEYSKKLVEKYEDSIEEAEKSIAYLSKSNTNFKSELDKCKKEYMEVKEREVPKERQNCPVCKRPLDLKMLEKVINDFEKNKEIELDKITSRGTELSEIIKSNEGDIESLYKSLEEYKSLLSGAKKQLKEVNAKTVEYVDISKTDAYLEIISLIKEKETQLEQIKVVDHTETDGKITDLHNELLEVEKQIALFENNSVIDEKIMALREKQMEYEQSKADAERILKQLERISRKKNELLTDEINSHFRMVKWLLFETYKNGDYKEICIPTYEGKKLGSHTNTGLSLLMKMDIVLSLQKYKKCEFPIFIDGAECLDSNSKSKIETDTQVIFLNVSEDGELVIK